MKAIAVTPGTPGSAHLADVPAPTLDQAPDGRGVLVRVIRVGLDGTDREINAGLYGAPPDGADFLVLGHESFGVVEEVGPNVTELRPGDYVVCRVRRAGTSLYDVIDTPDMTEDQTYFEHGISRVHGFLTEHYVEVPQYLIRIPSGLRHVGVLLEPTSVAEKGITQAQEVQRRLKVWRPRRAAVMGAGTLGLLATMALRNRDFDVVTLGLAEPPYLNSELVEALGATYVSTRQKTVADVAADRGRVDLVFECTGYSPIIFDAAHSLLAKNGVMVLASITGGDRTTDVPSDVLNLEMVLGNKVMVGTVSANREHFEAGVRDLAVAEDQYDGWLSRLLTHPVHGLEAWPEALRLLSGVEGVIKVYVEVSSE